MEDNGLYGDLTNPRAEIKGDSGIVLKMRGVDFEHEQWVESPRNKHFNSQEEIDLAAAKVFSRMFRACVEDVENLYITINGKKQQEFKPKKDKNGLISIESYTILMRALNQDLSLIPKIQEFYNKSIDLSKYIEIKKK